MILLLALLMLNSGYGDFGVQEYLGGNWIIDSCKYRGWVKYWVLDDFFYYRIDTLFGDEKYGEVERRLDSIAWEKYYYELDRRLSQRKIDEIRERRKEVEQTYSESMEQIGNVFWAGDCSIEVQKNKIELYQMVGGRGGTIWLPDSSAIELRDILIELYGGAR